MYKLSFELVPEECWYSNLRSVLSQSEWDVIRKDAYKRYRYRCACCGASGRMEAHEKWSYDEGKALQKLEEVVALCRGCHEVVHIGRTQLMGRQMDAMEHYMKVNQCSQMDFHAALQAANEEYLRRNKIEGWVTDLTWLKEKYGFTPKFK